ncbi:MAG: MFS transporter [Spirochaetales bacterium]|nr:MFS transporter [Spirochaetales bacterium]
MFNKPTVLFSGIQWFFWSGFGLIFSFIAAYYQEIGFTPTQIGLFTGLTSLTNILGQLTLGYLSDRLNNPGSILKVSLMAGVGFAMALYFVPPQVAPVVVVSILLSFFTQSLSPILDSWIMGTRQKAPGLDYGVTRALGSIGFALTTMLSGLLFDRFGLGFLFPLGAGLMGIAVSIVWLVQGMYGSPEKSAPEDTINNETATPANSKFFNPEMIAILPLLFFTFVAFRPTHLFMPILITSLGGTNEQIGYGLAMMAISEVPFMVASSKLMRRFKDTSVLMVALAMFVVRILTPAFANGPTGVIVLQLLQGPSFGLFWPAAVHILFRLAPEGNKTLAQTAGSLATFGLGSVVGSTLGGYLVEWYGLRGMYLVSTIIMLLVTFGYGWIFMRSDSPFNRVPLVKLPGKESVGPSQPVP